MNVDDLLNRLIAEAHQIESEWQAVAASGDGAATDQDRRKLVALANQGQRVPSTALGAAIERLVDSEEFGPRERSILASLGLPPPTPDNRPSKGNQSEK